MPWSSKSCSGCGALFECGAGETGRCWCNAYPAIEPDSQFEDCFCEKCLELRTVAAGRSAKPASSALVQGEDYYVEGTAVVFTAAYHRKRGYCCKNGCRHCPYG